MKKITIKKIKLKRELLVDDLVADIYNLVQDQTMDTELRVLKLFKLLDGEKINVTRSLLKPIQELEIGMIFESRRKSKMASGKEIIMSELYRETAQEFKVSVSTVKRALKKNKVGSELP